MDEPVTPGMEEHSPVKLSASLRQVWEALLTESPPPIDGIVTARQLTDRLNAATGKQYPIQTVLTLLNRWSAKGSVAKVPHIIEGSLQWGFLRLDATDPLNNRRQQVLQAWLLPMVAQWCDGDIQLALYTVQEALLANLSGNYPAAREFQRSGGRPKSMQSRIRPSR